MLNDAIDKIRDEMATKSKDNYVQYVGDYLTDYLKTHPGEAEKILTEGKTIAGSLSVMKEEARKNQSSGCGVLSDKEGFEIVLKYFGIEPGAKTAGACGFVSVDDLLGD